MLLTYGVLACQAASLLQGLPPTQMLFAAYSLPVKN